MIDLTTLSADDLDALACALFHERQRREGVLAAPADGDLFAHARIPSTRGEGVQSDGDVVRNLLMRAFGWRQAGAGGFGGHRDGRGSDLVSPSGREVAIRVRRVGTLAAAGTFATLPATAAFDMLACVALAPDGSVLGAVLLEREAFLSRAACGGASGSLYLALADALRLGHGAYDVTAALAAAQGGRTGASCAALDDISAPVGGFASATGAPGADDVAAPLVTPARLQRRRRRRTGTPSAPRPPSLRAQLAASLALACRSAETEGA